MSNHRLELRTLRKVIIGLQHLLRGLLNRLRFGDETWLDPEIPHLEEDAEIVLRTSGEVRGLQRFTLQGRQDTQVASKRGL